MAKREATQMLHCNACRHETKHKVLKEVQNSGYVEVPELDGGGYHWVEQYRILECCGCQDISRQRHFESDGPQEEVIVYPARTSRWLPKWRWELPYELATLLGEIYRALHGESYVLATLGTRALIERLLIHTLGEDQGTFGKHLDTFQERGFVSAAGKGLLEAAIEAGHAAMHRGYSVKPEELTTVLDILESVLLNVYVLPKRTEGLRNKIPARPKKK